MEHFGTPGFEFMSISKQSSLELAGKYVSLFTTAAHDAAFFESWPVAWKAVGWNGPQSAMNLIACEWLTSGVGCEVHLILVTPASSQEKACVNQRRSFVQTNYEQSPSIQPPIIQVLWPSLFRSVSVYSTFPELGSWSTGVAVQLIACRLFFFF